MTLREALIRDEGFRGKPYPDTTGHLTIGFGRNLTDDGITLAEAEFLLDNDISRHTADVLALLPWMLRMDEVRREALINLAFNIGAHGILEFRKMLAAAQSGNWAIAAIELLNSQYAQQVGSRAHRLATQLETGERV